MIYRPETTAQQIRDLEQRLAELERKLNWWRSAYGQLFCGACDEPQERCLCEERPRLRYDHQGAPVRLSEDQQPAEAARVGKEVGDALRACCGASGDEPWHGPACNCFGGDR